MPNIPKPTGINEIWASTGVKQPPGSTKIASGWVVEYPPYQMMNWVQNRQDAFIAHSNQHGVPEWDSVTEYQGNLSYTQGADGIIYKALETNRGSNPIDPLNRAVWVRAFEPFGVVSALTTVVNTHIANYQTLAGISNIVAARQNLSVYSRAETEARYAQLAGNQDIAFAVATSSQPYHAVRRDEVLSFLKASSETEVGVSRLATATETDIGTSRTTAVTPYGANAVYLKRAANLAGLPNVAAARANLGIGDIATLPVTAFLQPGNNLADVPDKNQARVNLGLTSTATQPETYFLRTGLNLSDIPSPAAARGALGLSQTAILPVTSFLQPGNNLSDVPDKAAARNALALSETATMPASTFMYRTNNLADITNVQAARNNLGLSAIVTKNVIGLSNPNGDIVYTRNADSVSGGCKLPDGTTMNWGTIQAGTGTLFKIPFTSASSYAVTVTHGPQALGLPGSGLGYKNANGFSLAYGIGGYQYIAIGY